MRVVDGAGAAVSEQVCELGSTVALRCEVRGLRMEGGLSLLWYRRDDLLNDDTTRGGIRYVSDAIISFLPLENYEKFPMTCQITC